MFVCFFVSIILENGAMIKFLTASYSLLNSLLTIRLDFLLGARS